MKNLLKIVSVFFGFSVLTACVTTQNYQQTVNQWQSENVQQLMNCWGYPDAGVKLPNGNTVYFYTRHSSYITPATPMLTPTIINIPGSPMAASSFNGEYIGGRTINLSCRTWFEVNPRGQIVNIRFQGNHCVANKNNRWAPQH